MKATLSYVIALKPFENRHDEKRLPKSPQSGKTYKFSTPGKLIFPEDEVYLSPGEDSRLTGSPIAKVRVLSLEYEQKDETCRTLGTYRVQAIYVVPSSVPFS